MTQVAGATRLRGESLTKAKFIFAALRRIQNIIIYILYWSAAA